MVQHLASAAKLGPPAEKWPIVLAVPLVAELAKREGPCVSERVTGSAREGTVGAQEHATVGYRPLVQRRALLKKSLQRHVQVAP